MRRVANDDGLSPLKTINCTLIFYNNKDSIISEEELSSDSEVFFELDPTRSFSYIKVKVIAEDAAGNIGSGLSNPIYKCTVCSGKGTLSTKHQGKYTSSQIVKNHGEYRCGICNTKDSGDHRESTFTCSQCGATTKQCRCDTHSTTAVSWGTCSMGGGTCKTCSGSGIVEE